MNLVDTDVLVDILRQYASADVWFTSQSMPPSVPGYVAMELKQGCRDKRELAAVERLLRPLAIIWPSGTACDMANSLYGPAKLSHNAGLIDSLIAVTAIEQSATLYTCNVKHFAAIPGLDVRSPYPK